MLTTITLILAASIVIAFAAIGYVTREIYRARRMFRVENAFDQSMRRNADIMTRMGQ